MKSPVPTFKLLLIGDSGTGKSCLLSRFIDDIFPDTTTTIGVDFKVKHITINDKQYKLTIWDTAGQERFRTLTSSYYRGAHGVILVYDVSQPTTFDNLTHWFNELETYSTSVVKIIVGNKTDKDRLVSRQQGLDLAYKYKTLYMETSAKTTVGVQDAFRQLVDQVPLLTRLSRQTNSQRKSLV